MRVGTIVAFFALLIATIVALSAENLDQAYQYIQEYTDLSIREFLIFSVDYILEKASSRAALWWLLTIPMGLAMKTISRKCHLSSDWLRFHYPVLVMVTGYFDKRHNVDNVIDLPPEIKLPVWE